MKHWSERPEWWRVWTGIRNFPDEEFTLLYGTG